MKARMPRLIMTVLLYHTELRGDEDAAGPQWPASGDSAGPDGGGRELRSAGEGEGVGPRADPKRNVRGSLEAAEDAGHGTGNRTVAEDEDDPVRTPLPSPTPAWG